MDRSGDTIVAPATAPGRSALALVRMSGSRALEIGRQLITPWPAAPRTVRRARLRDLQGAALDEGVAVFYEAPASFTGEHAVEFTCHGGPIVAASIVAACVVAGARPADAGEFTRRAVLSGKLDLLQAEAVGDLSDAASRSAAQVALSQLDGGLSRRITALRDRVVEVEALAAYDIDFPEEDDGPVPAERITAAARDVIAQIDALLATAPLGEIVREGATVVIAGAPNVGKSSLFNALLGRRRAIVTDVPGTTRDALEAVTEADGWPVRLVDTAGLRDATETVERLGIEVSREYLERADAVLACGDSAESLNLVATAVAGLSRAPVVRVRTKADLLSATEARRVAAGVVLVSAESGDGLSRLVSAIAQALEASHGRLVLEAPIVTRERHRYTLCTARAELQSFGAAWVGGQTPAVVSAVHLREATRVLEELIGSVDVEDVLDRLFSTFCVGK